MSKVIGIHQPNFLPWLGYFYKIKHSDCFVLLDNVDFQTGNASSITNRCLIKTINGVNHLTVPVQKSSTKLINQILIDSKQTWQKKHLKTISFTYSKSKYYNEIFPSIENILNTNHQNLSSLNIELIKFVCDYLKLNIPLKIASELDLVSTEKNSRIIELCKKFDGTIYLSGNGAKKYNDVESFRQANIELKYSNFQVIEYPQIHGEFIPKLSILDALFNLGTKTNDILN